MSAASRWGTPVSLIRLEGCDTRRFLHGQSSQAIELAQPGACLATCLISPTARMRGLALVAVEYTCLLYTSPSPRDVEESRMPSSA